MRKAPTYVVYEVFRLQHEIFSCSILFSFGSSPNDERVKKIPSPNPLAKGDNPVDNEADNEGIKERNCHHIAFKISL